MTTITRDVHDLARNALHCLAQKWSTDLLMLVRAGSHRHAELRRELGLSAKVLTEALRQLEGDGYIVRSESPTSPVQIAYTLTSLGDALLALRADVERWAVRHQAAAPSAARTAQRRQQPQRRNTSASSCPLEAIPTHLCIAVNDVRSAAQTFFTVFGIKSGPITGPGVVVGPKDTAGRIIRCAFRLRNLFIELIQPVSGDTTFRRFLDRNGPGIHHVGLRTRGTFDGIKTVLEERGGLQTATGLNNRYALFDFVEQFGLTIEIVVPELDISGKPSRTTPSRALGHHAIGHIGIVVHDAERAAACYANVVGAGVSAIRHVQPSFAPGVASPGAGARVITIRHGGIGVLLIEPIGSGPWRDFLEKRGNAVYSIGLNVSDKLRHTIGFLRRHGLRQIAGDLEAGFVQFDLTREFGFVLGAQR